MLNKLKFFKHSGIERFGITFIAVIAIFIGLFVAMSHMRNKDIAKAIKYEPIYLGDFKLSKSGTTGRVLGVYSNTEKTKSLVILKLNDTGLISTNAEDYKLFLTPAKAVGNVRKKFNAGASFFTFGDTGYMGILFTSATGFNNELAQIIIRNQSKLLDVDDEKSKQSMTENESFKYFDQGVFYINMGAINTPTLKLLDSDELNLQDVYSNVVLKARDSDIRAMLDTTIQSMVDTRKVIEEYHDRLTRFSANGLTVVDTPIPTFITDDNFSKFDNSANSQLAKNYGVEPTTESAIDVSTLDLEESTTDTKLADEVGVTSESETVEELSSKNTASTIEIESTVGDTANESSTETTGADTTGETTEIEVAMKPSNDVFDENFVYMPEYTYVTDNIFDGGIMFNWWESDVTKGYASLLNLGDKDLLSYVKSIPTFKYDISDSDQTWYMSNGLTVTDFIKQNSDLDYVNTLSSLLTTYTDNINKYKALKKSYQAQLLPKLLYLTLTRDNASLNYTTNTDKNLLIEY